MSSAGGAPRAISSSVNRANDATEYQADPSPGKEWASSFLLHLSRQCNDPELVRRLNEEQGVTFLLAEQNTNVALRFAHKGYILESGRVVMDGPAEEAAGRLVAEAATLLS